MSGRFSVAKFIQHCAELVEQFDVPGAKQRDRNRRQTASIRETWLPDGSLQLIVILDPERAAFYKTAVNLRTNPRRQNPGDGATAAGASAGAGAGAGKSAGAGGTNDGTAAGTGETSEGEASEGQADGADAGTASQAGSGAGADGARPLPQPSRMEAKLDAFVSILRDAIKTDNGKQAGVDTTILIRMDLQSLLIGIGSATIDGITTRISTGIGSRGRAAGVHESATDAISGTYSGCAFPRCDIPSSMVEFHHVGQWARRHRHGKGTDLDNGLPLCGFQNRLMDDEWEIRFDENRIPWFIPPKKIDWAQRPIRGGNMTGERAA